MRFTKMHGAGNDFVILDPGEVEGLDLRDLTRRICERHFGVGADGMLLPATSESADLKMIYLNSDGSPSEMCGNGIRCLARYARDRGLVGEDGITIETGAGIKKITLHDDGSSRVDMGSPEFGPEVELYGFSFLCISMGNPHAVTFLSEEEVERLDLRSVGPRVEKDPFFPEGTNVEFVSVSDAHNIRMRVWERGAGETLASGSGSCAAAVAALYRRFIKSPLEVRLDGGVVGVEWDGGKDPVYMSGPAEYICEGNFFG